MKSKQINFFITSKDYKLINDFINKNQIVIYKNDTSRIDGLSEDIHQIFLTKREYNDNILIASTPKGMKYFDIGRSYLLEFSLGGFYPSSKEFNRGRIYFVKSYYENDHLIHKSDVFNQWCEDFINFLKTSVVANYSICDDYLYSKSAIEWIEINNAVQDNSGQRWKQIKQSHK